ncbi:MAG: ABC transporter ATP-binding protein [Phycisphaeraceae bacterium]|nr:ABC transporter ATP-binding protein [Phycisphaeraceae bacterium]
MRRLTGLAWEYRARSLMVIFQQLVLVAFQLLGLGLAGKAIDYIRYRAQGVDPEIRWMNLTLPTSGSTMMVLGGLGAGVLLIALLRAALRFSATMTAARLSQRIIVNMRSRVYEKLQRLSFRFYDSHESGSIINRVTGDVQAVRTFVDGVMIQIITLVATLAAYLAFMFSIHVWLTLACLATTPLLYIASVIFARVVRPIYLLGREKVDHAVRVLAENIQGIHVVKCFAREGEEIAKFNAASLDVKQTRQRVFWKTSIFVPSVGFLTQINMLILMLYGGWLVIEGRMELGLGLVVFAELLRQFANQISSIANITNSVQMSLTGAQRVFEILDAPVDIKSKPDALRPERVEGRVTFENVAFSYQPGHRILDGVSFEVKPRGCIAIVGATGAGKTTLLSMIPRFYDPEEGRILLDGIDLRDLDLDTLRRSIGVVFQENFLFSATVAENIAFGHPDVDMDQIRKAAKIAAAHDFIENLSYGYETVIGENGVDLSGGQRQRLAIARAVLLEPSILLLDDATSAIDPETEHEILTAMDQAMEGRTTFVVAHRLSTLRRADHVIVLERGRVIQTGTHEELMSAGGHYRRAAKLQSADRQTLDILQQVQGPDTDKALSSMEGGLEAPGGRS